MSNEQVTLGTVIDDAAENASFEDGSGGNTTNIHEQAAAAWIGGAPVGAVVVGTGGQSYVKRKEGWFKSGIMFEHAELPPAYVQ